MGNHLKKNKKGKGKKGKYQSFTKGNKGKFGKGKGDGKGKKGKYGKLVEIGDHKLLADAIIELLSNPIDKELLQNRANDYHADNISNDYLDILIS